MVQLPNAGTHIGRLNGRCILAKAGTGALCVYVPVILANSEIAWHGKHTITLVKKDGEVQGRSLQTLKEVFGWDGQLETWDTIFGNGEDIPASIPEDLTFELVCEHEEYTPEGKDEAVNTFKIKFLNALGGGSRMPESLDRKTLIAEFGSKFRAMAGGKPAAKPAAAATAKPAATAKGPAAKPATKGPGPKAKPLEQTLTATMEEAWNACVAANPGISEEKAGEGYWAKMAELFGEEANNDTLTIQQFGQLKAAFES